MSKLFLAAAVLALTAASASAQPYGYGQRDYNAYGKYNDGGLGRYCPPGYYPHSWPNGNGIRCEAQDGRLIYNPAF